MKRHPIFCIFVMLVAVALGTIALAGMDKSVRLRTEATCPTTYPKDGMSLRGALEQFSGEHNLHLKPSEIDNAVAKYPNNTAPVIRGCVTPQGALISLNGIPLY